MIKIDDHCSSDLDVMAGKHYHSLVGEPLKGARRYHATQSLAGRIQAQRKVDRSKGQLLRVRFWDYLLNDNLANLEKLITSRPPVLKEMIEEIRTTTSVNFFSVEKNYSKATLTDFGKIVRNVFNYESYRDSDDCQNYCDSFRLGFCPYCNIVSVEVIKTKGLKGNDRKQALLQIDHFYPRSRHPYLALSFFNLIPGCGICNSPLKGDKRFDIDTHFNPFDKRFDDFFKFYLREGLLDSESDVVIKYENKQAYASDSLRDFNLESRYNTPAHKRMVYHLVQNFRHHSKGVTNSTISQFDELFADADEALQRLLENYNVPVSQKTINDVYLGKLKRDLVVHLMILK